MIFVNKDIKENDELDALFRAFAGKYIPGLRYYDLVAGPDWVAKRYSAWNRYVESDSPDTPKQIVLEDEKGKKHKLPAPVIC